MIPDMDSSEDFSFEVPVISDPVSYKILNCISLAEVVTSNGNDCSIMELGNSQDKETGSGSKHHDLTVRNTESNSDKQQLIDLDEPAAIVIDEDSEKDNDCTIVDYVDDNANNNINKKSNKSFHRNNVFCYDDIMKENKLLIELIERCLDMENSEGMLRIINRTLIPIYKDSKKEYRESERFQKALTKVYRRLEIEPERKFSHIRNLCETLKSFKAKKRVSLVTLKSYLKDPTSAILNEKPKKRKKIDVIDLDKDDDVQIVCTNDNEVSDVIEEGSPSPRNYVIATGKNSSTLANEKNVNLQDDDDDVILVDDEHDKENKTNSKNDTELHNLNKNKALHIDLSIDDDEVLYSKMATKPEDLLKPSHVMSITKTSSKIAKIEEKIGEYCKKIKALEEQEVTMDGYNSQYYKCELFKSKVVHLYKQLCKLTDSESVRKVQVRLKVAPGHPPGPARCLEELINNNIDHNGNPMFPDMHDVITCVEKANVRDGMGWSHREIEAEARALFVQYGSTIQKRRQKREWRDLMTYVKVEAPDPAEEDPALQARLLENTKIAKANENELLKRFAQMENSMAAPNPDLALTIENDSESDDSDFETNTAVPSSSNTVTEKTKTYCDREHNLRLNSYVQSCTGNITNNLMIYNPWSNSDGQITAADEVSNTEIIKRPNTASLIVERELNNINRLETNINASKTNVKLNMVANLEINRNQEAICAIDTHTRNNLEVNINTEVMKSKISVNSEVVTDLEAIQSNVTVKTETTNTLEVYGSNVSNNDKAGINLLPKNEITSNEARESNKTSELENYEPLQADTIVKREPLDIPTMLNQLGNNFTVTIFDIEDPFLVIEISDSSDSENEEIS